MPVIKPESRACKASILPAVLLLQARILRLIKLQTLLGLTVVRGDAHPGFRPPQPLHNRQGLS